MEKLLTIDSKNVIDFLKNGNEKKQLIHEKMYQISKEIQKNNDIIEMVSFQHAGLADMPHGSGNHKDITDTYLKYLNMKEKRDEELNEYLIELINEEIAIERTWLAYMVLNEPYFSILKKCYVEHEKYEVAERESGYSHQVFESYRKKGVELILKLYYSEKSIVELTEYTLKAEKARKAVVNRKVFEQADYQISIEDVFNIADMEE